MQRTLSILVLGSLLSACSTDLDINAPYKNITVVEGILNMRDSLHYIKINKAFLGSGDALAYAQVQDSNEWSTEAFEYRQVVRRRDGQIQGTFPLRDTLVTGREPGTFYGPTQRLYYFRDHTFRDSIQQVGGYVDLFLDPASTYSVELKVKGEDVSASTSIVNDFSIQSADQSTGQVINLLLSGDYGVFELNWTSGRNSQRYVIDYRFNYSEVRNGVEGERKSFTRRMATVVKRSTSPSEAMSTTLDGRRFFEDVASAIPADATVQRRIFYGIDFVLSVANNEFHTYLTLTEPVSGIIEDRPTYSNINNGYGILGSRYVKEILSKRLGPTSLNELADGNITGHLQFCSRMDGDQASPHYCP